ncbi:MAG: TerB family tellurite resistance protein [Proteobacteria bacterium]|nr:TerB family tellurite resistance protein [Pseudomonadota bacterium]
MSILGKLSGAAAGFVLGGGPIGALIGALAGHFLIDREMPTLEPGEAPGIVFTIAMIALAAKMAKADGAVTKDEVETFKRLFRVPPHEQASVDRIFRLAQEHTAGYEAYAAQIGKMLAGNPALLEDILDGLFEIAKADGVFHPGESAFLERVAEIFGFTPNEYRRIRAAHIGPDRNDPYVILGVDHAASDDEVKATYRMLVRENHPDKLIARGVPEEFIRLATDKLAAINAAYDRIERERKG